MMWIGYAGLQGLFEAHTAIRESSKQELRELIVSRLSGFIENDERLLAYADRRTHPDRELPFDVFIATERQLLRVVFVAVTLPSSRWITRVSGGDDTESDGGSSRELQLHRLHIPRHLIPGLSLEVFLSIDALGHWWSLAPIVPTINVRLPPALRVHIEEEWWHWEPPTHRELKGDAGDVLKRAAMWRGAMEAYRTPADQPAG